MSATAAPPPPPAARAALAERIDAALPQTQCTRCGYPDCRGYAEAMAQGEADINRCPPGGAEGIVRLSAITGRRVSPLDPERGHEGPRALAVIDEDWCIGCTLCIKACPVDCIVGASKLMHTVISPLCTGCELCVPVCPVDCIAMVPVTGERTGWAAWGPSEAAQARERYAFHRMRVAREQRENDERLEAKAAQKLADLEAASTLIDAEALARKRAVIEAARQRARVRQREPGTAESGTDTPAEPDGAPRKDP
ncbi:MAG: electron transport complex subunit RsxB [Burkholderiales bacterium]|nr:electron transport complex subunit RsxB [Burkholderiales bacterium]